MFWDKARFQHPAPIRQLVHVQELMLVALLCSLLGACILLLDCAEHSPRTGAFESGSQSSVAAPLWGFLFKAWVEKKKKKKSLWRGIAPGQTLSHWEGQERVRRETDIERPPGEQGSAWVSITPSPPTILHLGGREADARRVQGNPPPAPQSPRMLFFKEILTPRWWKHLELETGKV